MPKKPANEKQIESFVHEDASRRNIPPAEFQTMVRNQEKTPIQVAYERRNPDLDPQLIWRGKNLLDESPLVVNAPPLYIQEKIHPKVMIDDLKRRSKEGSSSQPGFVEQIGLFDTIKGDGGEGAKTEFYQHDQNWTNRMILGDSLQVMASLAEREGLRGKVQCIYFDPPYGIKFNSNFQWSTSSRDVTDGKQIHITREPEQVKAFRDTWRDGIHTYMSYLRDRLIAARELLAISGSLFLQIGDENVHRVRCVLEDVFGTENFIAQIATKTSGGSTGAYLSGVVDHVLWFGKDSSFTKYKPLFNSKQLGEDGADKYTRVRLRDLRSRSLSPAERNRECNLPEGSRIYRQDNLTSQSVGREKGDGAASWFPVRIGGREIRPSLKVRWKTNQDGMNRLLASSRVELTGNSLSYVRFLEDFSASPINNSWSDIGGIQSRSDPKVYVVQTPTTLIQRCMLMTTDPGDLVLDPTCGSGTSAAVAEQWGRRWITIDTSRVALALARARIMGARYPYYLLADSVEGKQKEAELSRSIPNSDPVSRNIRQGFVYERVPHITLKSIANNTEIDTIWENWQSTLEPLCEQLNTALGQAWQEWEIPRETQATWSDEAKSVHANWWDARIARQKEIDASIAAKADSEYLYDRPYEDKSKVRVAGPFTVESLSPHRTMIVNDDDTITDPLKQGATAEGATDFAQMILNTLRVAGVQQAHKEDRISFESFDGWPGVLLAGKGNYRDADGTLKTAGIFIGPEFGTVTRVDLVEAARECADAGFNVLISCAFNYEAQSTEFDKLGPIPVLKARMNADLHMQQDLANSGKGNLFVIFGEPDIDILDATGPDGQPNQIQVKINGVDVFDPSTGEVRSDEPDNIACWFIDSDYNGESFFVRQAYFLGQNDPYKSLKTSLKAEIDQEAWESLNSDTSVPFTKPSTGRIAVKVINHLGDEVMKVYRVGN
jgi:adenine-specific DNA-methyltransferase